jgi:hypothetical protein
VLEASVGRDDPRLMSTLNVLGNVLADLERNGEARAAFERVIETSVRTGREDDTKAIALANLSNIEVEAGDTARARVIAGDALALWIRLHGEDHPVAGEFTLVLARVLLEDDAVVEATAYARRAIAQLENGGDFHTKALADARFVLARALGRGREPTDRAAAIAAARAALSAYERQDRADDAEKVRTWLAEQPPT